MQLCELDTFRRLDHSHLDTVTMLPLRQTTQEIKNQDTNKNLTVLNKHKGLKGLAKSVQLH